MDESKVCCPKCQHEQDGQIECEDCGLIFARYNHFQKKQKEQEEILQAEKQQQPKTISRFFQVAFLIIVTASITYYFSRGKTEQGKPTADTAETPTATTQQILPEANTPTHPTRPVTQIATPATYGSPIEHASNATVSIETPWGIGSGFFVKENYIVTNKHVVETNKEELKDFRNKVQTLSELINLENQKIREMRQKMNELPEGPTKKQLAIIIEQRKEEIAKIMPKLEQEEKQLKNLEKHIQPGDIKIIMTNGSKYTVNHLEVSAKHDLALLSLYASDQTLLQRPAGNTILQQGDKVYTIGSPVGLRNTVTGGIFSGYRKQESDGSLFLQVDAPINPGNSGGPLIDEKGYVHGVNTMILRNTQGIGFAIPIETVYEEFHSTLY
ncbi:MAG: trypsin-like peptidase domain-containing protein [Desulfocapsaceae bacterium]|nr:trypsin-like peptidase domain-containing protein [Desulfocapsaceae bacterium]